MFVQIRKLILILNLRYKRGSCSYLTSFILVLAF